MSEEQRAGLEDIDLFATEDQSDGTDESIGEFEELEPEGGVELESEDGKEVGTEEEDGGYEINNITQLAEDLSVDPSVIYGLQVPMGDGVDPVSLSVLKDSYQDTQRGVSQLADDKAAFEREKQTQQLNVSQEAQFTAEESQRMANAEAEVQSINDNYNNIDWASFEREMPGEAALQRQKLQEAFNQALARKETASNSIKLDRERKQSDYMQSQANEVKRRIPEWSNPEVYKRERGQIRELLTSYGYTEQDIQQLNDAKSISLVNDLARFKASMKDAAPIKKKEISKQLRSGSLQRVAKSKDNGSAKRMQHAARSKDKRVKADAVAELLNNI